MAKTLTTTQAGRKMKLSPQRVNQLCNNGKLKGRKVGARWQIRESDIRKRLVGVAGRPKGKK